MVGARCRRGRRRVLQCGQRIGGRSRVRLQQRVGQRRQRERIAADAAAATHAAEELVDAGGLAVRGRRAEIGEIVERTEACGRRGGRRGSEQVGEGIDLRSLRVARAAFHGVGEEQRIRACRRGGPGTGRTGRGWRGWRRRSEPCKQVGKGIVAGAGRGGCGKRRRRRGVGNGQCPWRGRAHAHAEFEAAHDQPRAIGERGLLARAQRHAVALHRIAAAVDDEVLAVAAQHLGVHARDRAVRIVEHQRVGVGASDGAPVGPEIGSDGLPRRSALPGDDSDMDHESAPEALCPSTPEHSPRMHERKNSEGVFIPWSGLAISP